METRELIGRGEQLARLEGAFEGVRGGRGQVLMLAGEAGVGKTRLAEDALARSSLDVLVGRARQDATPPYGPIASALRDCLRRSPEEDCGPLATHLSMLLPELGPPPVDASPETLVEAILGAFAAASRRRPLAVFLDDLQWADNATIELLPLLAERIASEPAVVVATYRSDEIGRGHPVRRLRDDLRRARLLNEIAIGPLDRENAARLLARAVDATPSEALVDLVFEKTQGVPLYIEELADALASSGRLQEGRDGVSLASGETVPIPESIRDAVVLRLDSLSEPARDTLEVAAVAGMEFDLELVAGLAGQEAGLEELLAAHVVLEAGSGTGAFRHALIREAIRDEIAWSKRRSLNRSIAAYLDRAGAPPEQVAEHWLAANEHAPARDALLQVAERSCRLHAYRDAARAGHRALEIWPEGEDEEKRLFALEQLAHCAQVSSHLGDAVRALREVAGSPLVVRDGERRASTMRALATLYGLQGSWEHEREARIVAAEAFEAASMAPEAAGEWLAVAGRQAANSTLDRALETTRRARDLAVRSKRREVIARAKGFEGNILAMQGRAEEGRALAQEALSIALESGETEAASEAFRRLASVLDYSSDFGGARDAYATAVDYCRTQGDDANARVCLGCMSFIVYRTGEWKRALDVCREVIEDAASPAGSSSIAHGISGLIRAYRGETRPARKTLEEAHARARRGDVVIMELVSRFGLALVAELEGDDARAAKLHEDVLEGWRETQDRHDLVPVFLWQSTFFARQGQEREVTRRADALSSMASATGNPEALAALAHALGELAGLAGQTEESVKHLEQALAQTEKLEIPLEHALTAWRLGTAFARAGKGDCAVRHLSSAYRLARNLGARPLAALIAAGLEAQGERVEEGGHPDEEALAGRGGLTRRQAEITRLLAEGLTNKEIAQKLFLSPRTIDMHVGNILERLDCRSRTEAARKAAELGLLD